MFSYQNIIVLIDSSEDNQSALLKAEKLANASGAGVTLFSSGYNSTLANNRSVTSEQSDAARDKFVQGIKLALEEKAQAMVDNGVKVETVAVWDKHPSQAIISFLEQHKGDLVIKNTHHQNVMQRTLFSHLDWDLIRYSPIPLLLTKNTPWPNKISITAAVDPVNTQDKPSTMDQDLISAAKLLSERLNASLDVLHVYDPTPLLIYLDQPALDAGEITEQIRQQHQDALDQLCTEFDLDPANVHLETGSPGTMIPDHLYQNDSHIVVMGAASRQGLDRLLIGHTAERILDRISADILVIKAPDEA